MEGILEATKFLFTSLNTFKSLEEEENRLAKLVKKYKDDDDYCKNVNV
jgi:hypothetical protein